eukprot:jgi/Ulvmu1/5275/UM022_0069.1
MSDEVPSPRAEREMQDMFLDPTENASAERAIRMEFLTRAEVRQAIDGDPDLRRRVHLAIMVMRQPGRLDPAHDPLRMLGVNPDTAPEVWPNQLLDRLMRAGGGAAAVPGGQGGQAAAEEDKIAVPAAWALVFINAEGMANRPNDVFHVCIIAGSDRLDLLHAHGIRALLSKTLDSPEFRQALKDLPLNSAEIINIMNQRAGQPQGLVQTQMQLIVIAIDRFERWAHQKQLPWWSQREEFRTRASALVGEIVQISMQPELLDGVRDALIKVDVLDSDSKDADTGRWVRDRGLKCRCTCKRAGGAGGAAGSGGGNGNGGGSGKKRRQGGLNNKETDEGARRGDRAGR